jgi:hypothetical protein
MSQWGRDMNLLDLARSAIHPAEPQEAPATDSRTSHWRVTYPSGGAREVLLVPPATADEVHELYPAARLEALRDTPRRSRTRPEVDELRALIDTVLRDDSEADRTEALTVAMTDPSAALVSLRTLAGELRLNEKWLGHRYDTRVGSQA